jgi:hypothetical protein
MSHPPHDQDRPPTLVAVPNSPSVPGPLSPGEILGRPGASAHAYYGRRRAAEWRLYRRGLPLRLLGIAVTGLLSGLAARQVVPPLAGWVAILATGVIGWGLRFRVSQDAHNWRRGARRERRTARQLTRLAHHGWIVFHDLAVPGSRANVDHLVIGPTGVFLVDSKNWRGRLVFASDGTLWHGSFPLTATLATIGFEAAAISNALGMAGVVAEPLMVVHGSTIPWGEQYLGGVAIVPGHQLVPTLLALPLLLTDQQITEIADRAANRLRPAA